MMRKEKTISQTSKQTNPRRLTARIRTKRT